MAAEAASARRDRLNTQTAAVFEVSRRYHNMLLARATRQASRALDDGIRKAFVARRAVEFRLGLDLEQERGRHTFVEPPQTWANDIFRIG